MRRVSEVDTGVDEQGVGWQQIQTDNTTTFMEDTDSAKQPKANLKTYRNDTVPGIYTAGEFK